MSTATVVAPAAPKARTMSTRRPTQVRSTAGIPRMLLLRPAPGLALVRPREERERRAGENAQVEPEGAVLHVPDVELDAFVPGEACAAVDLGPAGDPGQDLQPSALAVGVALDLIGEGGARADEAHVASDDVPELRQLVDREPAEQIGRASCRERCRCRWAPYH